MSAIKIMGDDHVLPFQAEGLDVRGRVVRLGPAIDTILSPCRGPWAKRPH
jgi:molecular chaperone Hsp33